MAVLELQGVSVAWAAARPILNDVSFVLDGGFHGLVGANGAGKTTLLRVLAGEIVPSEGLSRVRPSSASVVYCPQTIDEPGPDVFELATSQEGFALEIQGRLGLRAEELERWPTLSPGERKRWQIGAALAREPDVLLLDEPTNHLDGAARERLLAALDRFRGTCVIVSHDRAVLERLPRSILRVEEGGVRVYAGRWSEARAQWEQARREREEAHAEAKSAVRVVAQRLDAARRKQEAAARGVRASARMKHKNDHDARSMGAKVVAGWAAARAGRTVQTVRRDLERAESRVPVVTRDVTLGGKVFAKYERAPHAVLFHLDAREVCAGDHALLRDVRLNIGREERVRILGENGAGKTTLLSALLRAHGRPERVLFLPQELTPVEVSQLVHQLHACSDEERGRVLSVFSALGSDPERLLHRRAEDAAALSPGEARKFALALGLGKHAWALVLDEPTNHLDLPTIERLESALSSYPGCVVLVTHDDTFARAVTDRALRVEGGTVRF